MKSILLMMSIGLILIATPRDGVAVSKNQRKVSEQLGELVGRYAGSWTMFGVDSDGRVVKVMAWTDTLKAENPQVEEDRAFVSTISEMRFEGGRIPPLTVSGKEGFLMKDGKPEDPFIEMAGQTYRMVKVGENVWSYSAEATGQELVRLGFPQNASGQHVLIKVVNTEQGVETHRISRVTTVSWTDRHGERRWMQFVSLQGFHKREQR